MHCLKPNISLMAVFLAVFSGAAVFSACGPDTEEEQVEEVIQIPEPPVVESRRVVMQFIEAYNNRDTSALEAIFADPVQLNGDDYDPSAFIRNSWVDRLWVSFPDAQITPTHILAEDEYVTLRTRGEMTGDGEYMGHDVDGKTIRITEMSLLRVQDGKIVEWWYENDMLGFWEQLGLVENPIARR